MDAIELLESQHREVEDLFEEFHAADTLGQKRKLFATIADKLTVHATIEEEIFYPYTMTDKTGDKLREALEEHLAAKRIIADVVQSDLDEETLEAKAKVLEEQIEHHVGEEEEDLFPMVRKLVDKATLVGMADQMLARYLELEQEDSPRERVLDETKEAAPL